MKPIHLNLAAKPYRDYRAVNVVIAVLATIIAGFVYLNVETYLRYRTETRDTTNRIATLTAQAENEQRRADATQQRIKQIDVKALASQTQFANAQLAERAFSWSELLDRLEHVLPDDVRIDGVSPVFLPNGNIHLNLGCQTKTGNGMVNTINRFNADPHFANAFPTAEERVSDTEYHFGIGVDYKPALARTLAVTQ